MQQPLHAESRSRAGNRTTLLPMMVQSWKERIALDIILALIVCGLGLGLVLFFAEQLVKGVIGTSMGFGLSAFLLSVIFIGFDPDNLAVGAAAAAERVSGIALGSILGGA